MEPILKLFRKSSRTQKREKEDEEKRLEDLYAYEILDTLPEQDFEELVSLAVQVTGCPIASITFIDRNRQWFKASRGLPVPETTRDVSFCTHTIALEGDLIVEDARKDKRFANNPFVTSGLEVVFYAGTPIYSPNGHKLGTVCVIDQKTRSLSESQMASLQIIARQVTHLLDLRLRTRLLQERSDRLLAENQKSFDAFFAADTLPKWIYEIETLRILQVNEAATRYYGYTKEEFLQLTVFNFRDEKEPEDIHKLVQRLNHGDEYVSFETVHKRKDGNLAPVEVRLRNIVYNGKAARMATMTDISEKQELRKKVQGKDAKNVQQVMHATLEEERAYIGKELQDMISQILSGTKLYLEVAASNPGMKDEMIRLSQENINTAIKEIKALSRTLASPTSEFNLLRSLDELINSYLSSGRFNIELSGSADLEELPADMKITLFRIVQEALNNIEQHAGATDVSIEIEKSDQIVVRITDNGQGFDPDATTFGQGITNLKNRVAFYNGVLEVDSSKGCGCTFYVELPLPLD